MNRRSSCNDATVRAGPLVNLASIVNSLGVNPKPVFRQTGFEIGDFQDPDHRVPYLRASRLLADCVEATGCDHLGVLLGQNASPSHLGIAGFLLRAAPTVEQALRAVVENLDLHDEGGTATLDIGSEYTKFGYVLQLAGVSATEQIYDLAAVMLCKIMQVLCCDDWVASTVKLVRHEPGDRGPYRRFFRSALFFNSTECSIEFRNDCLSRRPPAADELLYEHLKNEARQLHELQQHEMMDELQTVLTKGLLKQQFSASHIGDVFGIHERTLHRRLQMAGTSFRRELDLARQSVSEQLLGGTSLLVCDIASALGYADSSGFIRAFQRWSGISPSDWRKQNSPLAGNRRAK